MIKGFPKSALVVLLAVGSCLWLPRPSWAQVKAWEGTITIPTYAWEDESTYVKLPPYFVDMPEEPAPIADISGARCLALARAGKTDEALALAHKRSGYVRQAEAVALVYAATRDPKPTSGSDRSK